MAASAPTGTVIVGALRDRAPEPSVALSRMLAGAARRPGHRRIRLGPLSRADVARVVSGETGQHAGGGVGERIHARTGGNPFLIVELSRHVAGEGVLTAETAARAGVPSAVRDVVRGRMAGLDEDTRHLLRAAALIGAEGDIGLLARVADVDARSCLDRLDELEALALLGPARSDPRSFRFRHDLVRESVATSTPLRQRTRLHLRIADALDDAAPAGGPVSERVAHHLWAAGPLADPVRTASALSRAAA
ncbi:hypothetical protein AB0C07_09330 [Actinoplanes missouriensis]|uniref:hypothetical protein n=1 Tax=Actinoplanes missouriensis TaxID=1866 RepID=UPI0033F3A6CE